MSDSEESDISQEYIISLHNLPVEIFLCICSFLNATTLHNKLRLVCKRFYDILSDESYWSIWMKRRWPLLKTPALEISNEDKKVSLRSVYYHIDKELYLWCENGKRTRNIELKNFHIAEVDAVKLVQNGDIVITGSRDRNIALWKVHEDSTQPFKYKANAHLGWVWDMAIESGNRFYSGSWDSMIKLWDIEAELVQVSGFKCQSAALSIVSRPDILVAGQFSPRIEIFDPRNGPNSLKTYSPHRKSVMAIKLYGEYLISASEDCTIVVTDLRTDSVCKTIILQENDKPRNRYARSLSYDGHVFYIGDSRGMIHVLNTADKSFEITESFDIGHTKGVTDLWHGLGSIITGSDDQTVRIFSPTSPPSLVVDIQINSGVTALDYMNSVLAVGCSENHKVSVWFPSSDED